MSKNKHVVKGKSGGWDVKSGGVAVACQSTQKDAIQVANTLAKIDRTEVVIPGRDGKIRDKNSFGKELGLTPEVVVQPANNNTRRNDNFMYVSEYQIPITELCQTKRTEPRIRRFG